MKLQCSKCNTILTTDLTPTRHVRSYDKYTDKTVSNINLYSDLDVGQEVRKKSFIDSSKIMPAYGLYYLRIVDQYWVNKDDTINIQFKPFKNGNGCCDNAGIEVSCQCCKNVIGFQHSDCYELKRIALHKQHVYTSKRRQFLRIKSPFEPIFKLR